MAVLFIAFIRAHWIKIRGIMAPFVIGAVISYIITSPVRLMERKGIPRRFAILFIYIAMICTLALAVFYLLPVLFHNMKELAEILPDVIAHYKGIFDDMISAIRYSRWSEDIKAAVLDEIQMALLILQDKAINLLGKAIEGLAGTVELLLRSAIALVVAFYFVNDAERFKKAFLSTIPRKWRESVQETGAEINVVLSNFIRGQIVISAIVGGMEAVGLYIVGVNYALMLGIIGGITNIIPYFGPYIGAVPAVILAFIQSPLKALWAVVVFTAVQQIENAVITPRIIKERLGLHPVVTILVILTGGSFFGVIGLLFAVPVTAILRVILRRAVKSIIHP